MSEEEENEATRELFKKFRELESVLKSQKKIIEKYEKEAQEKIEKEKATPKVTVGYCDKCNTSLTKEESEQPVCPYCGNKKFTPY